MMIYADAAIYYDAKRERGGVCYYYVWRAICRAANAHYARRQTPRWRNVILLYKRARATRRAKSRHRVHMLYPLSIRDGCHMPDPRRHITRAMPKSHILFAWNAHHMPEWWTPAVLLMIHAIEYTPTRCWWNMPDISVFPSLLKTLVLSIVFAVMPFTMSERARYSHAVRAMPPFTPPLPGTGHYAAAARHIHVQFTHPAPETRTSSHAIIAGVAAAAMPLLRCYATPLKKPRH